MELLIVVAVIGIIAAMIVPNFLDTLEKAKQKRTVAEMREWGVSAMSWVTDQVGAAAAGSPSMTTVDLGSFGGSWEYDEIRDVLTPAYTQQMPERDGWKSAYSYGLNVDDPLAALVAVVGSPGRDGEWGDPVSGTVGGALSGSYSAAPFDPTDYDQDIVWADGYFLRWPEKREPVP